MTGHRASLGLRRFALLRRVPLSAISDILGTAVPRTGSDGPEPRFGADGAT